MKRTLSTVGVVFVLAAVAIAGWLVVVIQQTHSRTDAAVQRISDATEVDVTFVVDVPPGTPADQPLYIAGSSPRLGNWDSAGVRLDRDEDGRYRKTIKLLKDMSYHYKITRGTWSTVERTADDEERPNRELQPTADGEVAIDVAMWIDKGRTIPGKITLTGDVRLHKLFPSERLGNERTLIVLVPPGYDEAADRRYPVLYMNDGQNLMDQSTSFNGVEWRVDETVYEMIRAGELEPIIVVGVYNTPDRTAEYTPGASDAARGDDYAAFLAKQVKPFIDKTYRTMPDRANTGIGGGGLGAVAALHTLHRHPETFSRCLAFNPYSWGGEPAMLSGLDDQPQRLIDSRYAVDVPALAERLTAAGAPADQVLLIDAPAEANREADWADRFDEALRFLFGG